MNPRSWPRLRSYSVRGIRGRLLALALGVAVPLALVGLAALWGMWTTSRRQLDDSVRQQAELAAVALERWIEAQREPLTAIAIYTEEREARSPAFAENLRFMSARPYLIDLRVLDAQGGTEIAQPANAEPLPSELVNDLYVEIRRRRSWAVVTDWRTRGAERPVLAIGVPVERGGTVVSRVDGPAVSELFRQIELSDGAVIAVFDSRGQILYRSATPQVVVDKDVSGTPLFAALNDRSSAVVEAVSPFDGVRRVYGLARAGKTDCVVLVGVARATLHEPALSELARYALFSLLALLCAAVAALIIARSIARPLRRLRVAAQQLGEGDLSARATVTGSSEIAELGTAFNAMAAQIEEREVRLTEHDRLKSEFVGNVSHELRTPLTTIKTLTNVMLRNGQSEEERREYLQIIGAECDRQIDLVLNLLDLSRIETGTFNLTPTRVDVAEVARACFIAERQAAEARGHDLRLDAPAELPPARADYGGLRRALCALVDNAVKHTPDGGRITLAAHTQGEKNVISVTDTGRGIAPEDLPHVFEKFYRGRPVAAADDETAFDESTGYAEAVGTGLGLYLARNIIERMGGSISVESEAGRGSTFTVLLPVWREDDSGEEVGEEKINV